MANTLVQPNLQNNAPQNPFAGQGQSQGYKGLRDSAQQEAGNEQAQNLDAISRRFAAMGNMNSGSYVQAQQDAGRAAATQAQDQIGKINAQEQAMHDQGALQTEQLGEQNNEFTQGQKQQQSQFESELPLKQQQLDLEANQQGMDAAANAFNERLAGYQANHSGGLGGQGGLFGFGNGLGGSSPLQNF